MASINAFYRNSSASTYASQLFSGAKTQAPTGTSRDTATPTYVPGASAAEKAISRIIEILALGGGDSEDAASVDESFGHITAARGTKNDDKLTLAGRTVSNVSADAGDDTVTVKTTSASSIDGGDGADQIKLAARFISDITGGKGDDTIEMSGESILTVDGGAGNDTLKVAATTALGVGGGEGDDNLYLEGKRLSASGGTGNDTVTFNIKDNGTAEYAFAKGDGKDTIASDGPLNIKLTGYMPSDVTVTASDNKLMLTFKGSEDKITMDFAKGSLGVAKPDYTFALDKGALLLKIA
ncbi:hypothetical protein [Rhizobium sp. RU36D]|uniref:hypothetical protein n=1 Tax=Rhizobium sp. RU36D TaxID=1907415 RepID=UPI0009D8C0D7|nr:hypothetical protein [Rhizobium sp. RU36D]SMD07127.1 hypothetical protein SAMN05880593_11947 [Rhizobium sp. RU36D]